MLLAYYRITKKVTYIYLIILFILITYLYYIPQRIYTNINIYTIVKPTHLKAKSHCKLLDMLDINSIIIIIEFTILLIIIIIMENLNTV